MKSVEFYNEYNKIKVDIFKLQREWNDLSIIERMKEGNRNEERMNKLNNELVKDELTGSKVDILA